MTNTETYFNETSDFKDRKVPWASKQKNKQKKSHEGKKI